MDLKDYRVIEVKLLEVFFFGVKGYKFLIVLFFVGGVVLINILSIFKGKCFFLSLIVL